MQQAACSGQLGIITQLVVLVVKYVYLHELEATRNLQPTGLALNC